MTNVMSCILYICARLESHLEYEKAPFENAELHFAFGKIFLPRYFSQISAFSQWSSELHFQIAIQATAIALGNYTLYP